MRDKRHLQENDPHDAVQARSSGMPESRSHGSNPIRIVALLAFLLALIFSGSAAGQDSEPGPGVLRTKLSNGLRVVIVRNPIAPVVTTVVNYLAGSNEAPAGFPGTAHAQEHMMFRGSPGLSGRQLADISAALGGQYDAETQQVVTRYFFTVPREDLSVALHIEAIRMRGVLDSEKLWRSERGAIEQEVAQDLSNPEYVFYTRLLAAMFKGTPYAHDALGTRASFDKTTGAMLKHFYDTWYVPNNAILVIVGDIQPQAALAEVKRQFSGIPRKTLPQRASIHLAPVAPQALSLKTDLPYGMVAVVFRMPGYQSPDYAASQVLGDVMNNQRGDLIGLAASGKALDAGFSLTTLPRSGLGYVSAAFPRGGDPQALLQAIRNVLARNLAKGYSQDFVATAKRHVLTDAELEKNSVSGLAMAWSDALAVEGFESPREDVAAIQQVSAKDVDRVARKCLDLDHAVTVVFTPQPSEKPTAAKGFGGKESFAPRQAGAVQLPSWAAKPLKRLSLPKSNLKPVSITLDNGLRLIVQPTKVSKTVEIYARIKNNPYVQVPAGQEGVDEVLDQLLAYGTTSLDRIAYQAALDEIGAYASAGVEFSLQVLADHLERGLELLADNELRPALPATAFNIVQRQVADAVSGRRQSPEYLTKRALLTALFPKGDPVLREETRATVSSLRLEDVKAYYRTVFRPDLTTIVVIGSVSSGNARKLVEKYFGSWKAEGAKPELRLPQVPLNRAVAVEVPNASRVQDKVVLAQDLGLNRYHPDYYTLQLGNHVLGGGFYATRLYQDLRENSGLVYSVSSSFDIGKSRGIYLVGYACDPGNVSKARAIVERNLREMQTTPVGGETLRQAKAMLLRELTLAESSLEDIAQGLLHRADLNLPLNEPVTEARRCLNTTAQEIQAAFAKWIHPRNLVQVTEGPPPR